MKANHQILTRNVSIKRTLRYKILFVVFPLFLISFIFFGITAYFSINKSITNIAKEFIGYRLKEVLDYAQNQPLPADFNEDSQNIFNNIVLSYAQKFDQETFIIVPYEYQTNNRLIYTFDTNIFSSDLELLHKIMSEQEKIKERDLETYNSWINITTLDQRNLVGIFIPNTEIQSWFVLLGDEKQFYAPVKEVMIYLMVIVVISLIILTILVLFFVNFITKPLTYCVETIQSITDSMDFSKRVRISYPDEIGILGQYFNNMVKELEQSYNQIKNYAYQTVLAKQKEERIRFIFQKYVPSDVIDHVLNRSTDTMLIGTKQNVTMLFSDIRDFTIISEKLPPEELVLSLNAYFTGMVEQVINNRGIIDKFIGDAIMGVFGAPAVSPTAADDALKSALLMVQELQFFNQKQKAQGKITFEIGIGINTGDAIVGNIGSEQKLDYTVIGDAVNLGARLEGLTKFYQMPILISEFTKQALTDSSDYLFINVDTVRVKGKKKPVIIYSPQKKSLITPEEEAFYARYHRAQQYYYQGSFEKALELFKELPQGYYLVLLYIERCERLIFNPPEYWEGIETWEKK
ncbi:MAG: adenylate/guanylate cyclase domain-containing protein [Brevinema sp.]